MKYRIKIIKLNGNWSRVEYDDKEFTEIDQALEYLGAILEEVNGSTTLILNFSKGIEAGKKRLLNER